MNVDTGCIYRTQEEIDAAIARGEDVEIIGPRVAELDKLRETFKGIPIKEFDPRAFLEEAITRIPAVPTVPAVPTTDEEAVRFIPKGNTPIQKMMNPGDPLPTTDEAAIHLLPGGKQRSPAEGLYICYRKQGDDIDIALTKTLEFCAFGEVRTTSLEATDAQ